MCAQHLPGEEGPSEGEKEYHAQFSQIYLSKPTTSDANDETQSLFPKEARLRNLT